MSFINALFFGVSGCTQSGLNVVDVNNLLLYQQIVLYIVPSITTQVFVSIVVVEIRLWWFERRLKQEAPRILRPRNCDTSDDGVDRRVSSDTWPALHVSTLAISGSTQRLAHLDEHSTLVRSFPVQSKVGPSDEVPQPVLTKPLSRVKFTPDVKSDKALYVPPPRERENGEPLVEIDTPKPGITSLTKQYGK